MLARGTKIINDVFFSIFNLTDPIPLNIRGDLVLLLTGNETGVAADAFIDIVSERVFACLLHLSNRTERLLFQGEPKWILLNLPSPALRRD